MRRTKETINKRWGEQGHRLRALRKEIQREEGRKITQREFASRFKIRDPRGKPSVRKVNAYESGECKLPAPLLAEIKHQGYSLDDLFSDGRPVVEERETWQKDPRRLRLVGQVRELAANLEVSEDVIETLLRVVKTLKGPRKGVL